MNISVNTKQLATKLKLVDKILSKNTLLPILANVRMRTDIGEVALTTTNMELALTTACPVTVNEPGIVTVPVKPLLHALSQIGDAETHLAIEKNQLRIAAGTFKMRLPTLPHIDFPAIPETPDGGILLPGDVFRAAIRRVRYAISDTDRRYLMAGALLSVTADVMALVATDGKRLALTAAKAQLAKPMGSHHPNQDDGCAVARRQHR
jgi:DNA polymerase-3 subunit beta